MNWRDPKAQWTSLALGAIALAALFDLIPRPGRTQTARGSIYVDSPEVYTRERLVNDRYEEDEWLRDELKKTASLEFGPQANVSESALQTTSGSLGLGGKAPPAVDAGKEAQPTTKPAAGKSSPIDQFADRSSYRDAVRAELIENQLDDRHDLDGNTVYRLKFDCAVVPIAKNGASAVVEVRMLKVGDPKVEPKDGGAPDEGAKTGSAVARELRSLAGRDLYWAWLRETFAEAQATLDKRFGEMFAALPKAVAAAEKKDSMAVPAEPGDQVKDDLRAARDALVGGDPKRSCTPPTEDLMFEVPCLMKLSAAGARVADPREQKARLRSAFAAYFAERTNASFEGLIEFVAKNGDLKLDSFDLFDKTKSKNQALQDEFEAGFARFQEVINPEASEDYAYAVAPKERADSVGRESVLGERTSYGISAAGPVGTVAASAEASDRREREVYASLIERNPRVVGFSNTITWGATFGWVIGPRFGMPERAGNPPRFEQQAAHYSLSAIVSAPSWWTRVEMQILVYWLDSSTGECTDEQGVAFKPCPPKLGWGPLGPRVQKLYVRLPGDTRLLGERIARRLKQSADDLKAPTIAEHDMDIARLEVGQKGEVIIPGQNLWRSPVVTLGTQKAKRVEILPNMNGLVAYFEPILEPAGWTGPEPYKNARLTVWTSQKDPDSVVGRVWIYPAQKALAASPSPSAQPLKPVPAGGKTGPG